MASIGNLFFHGTFYEGLTFTQLPLPGPYTLDDGNGPTDTVFTSGEDVNAPFTQGWPTDGFHGTYESNGVLYIVVRQGPYYDMYSTTDPAVSTLAAGTPFPTFNTADFTTCFLSGTLIATPEGAIKVEGLQIGDHVVTQNGDCVPVKWIGRQTLLKLFSGPRSALVRIRAGALGLGLPHSDLTVTGDHGMVLDGLVINASALVNGDDIDWVPTAELGESYTVYHVETEAHDVILANGAPTETFVDYRDRRAFDNFQEYLDLYGAERLIPEMPQPRISSARHLPPALRHRLGQGGSEDIALTA